MVSMKERRVDFLLVNPETGVWLLFGNLSAAQRWQRTAWAGSGTIVKVLDFPSEG